MRKLDKKEEPAYSGRVPMDSYSAAKMAELVAILRSPFIPEIPEVSRITVHATVSRVAVLYEKMRNAVEYRDDHLLRKAAILRILKRQIALESDAVQIATHLIRELIAARYLPNATLPETLIQDAARTIGKFFAMRVIRSEGEHQRWLMGLIAAELEDVLADRSSERALIQFLYEPLGNRIVLTGADMDESERRLQVYIACWRAMFKLDDDLMGYQLARTYHAEWMRPETWMAQPEQMALQMVGVEMRVRSWLRHPWGPRFLFAVRPWAVGLGLIRRATQEIPGGAFALFQDPASIGAAVLAMADRRYKESALRLRRGIVRAMLYLFSTKMLLAIGLEIPIESWLYHKIDYLTLAVNVLFPPTVMFFVGLFIRLPGKDNTKRLGEAARELLSPDGPKGLEIRIAKQRSRVAKTLFRLAYFVMFIIVFGTVSLVLQRLRFTWISSGLFLFFLCLVSFFAFRLRNAAHELVVVRGKETLFTVLLDFFSLPILRVGHWLSISISRINIFVFLFDFIIEAPFKLLLDILEEWFAFMKEKKEEIQ